MADGDLMALMVTGRQSPGIYEIGRLTGPASPTDGMDLEYAVDVEAAERAEWAVPYAAVMLKTPLPRDVLMGDPVLRRSEPFRAPRMSNPTFFSLDEVAVLSHLLDGRLSKSAARSVGWAKVLA